LTQSLSSGAAALRPDEPWKPTGGPDWLTDWFAQTVGRVMTFPAAPPPVEPEPAIETVPIWFSEAQGLEFSEGRLEPTIEYYAKCTGPATPAV